VLWPGWSPVTDAVWTVLGVEHQGKAKNAGKIIKNNKK